MNTLEDRAREIRRMVIKMIAGARGGHAGASLSKIDILTALYFRVLKLRPMAK